LNKIVSILYKALKMRNI